MVWSSTVGRLRCYVCVLCFGGSGEPWQDSRSYSTTAASAVLALCTTCNMCVELGEGSAPQVLDFQISVKFSITKFLKEIDALGTVHA